MPILQFSGEESATFGLNIWRADASGADADTLLACDPPADLVVVRDTVARMQKCPVLLIRPFDAELRDHILSFRKELRPDNMMAETGIDCEVAEVRANDWAAISDICMENFTEYPGHYQQSPYLQNTAAAKGMFSWLEELARIAEQGVFVVRQFSRIVGVLGYSYSQNTAELAIAAISAAAGIRQRNLLLVEATRRVEQRLRERGIRYFLAKTQATNTVIQRDLVRFVGCEPAAASATAHIHLFLARIGREGNEIIFEDNLQKSLLAWVGSRAGARKPQRWVVYQKSGSEIVRLRALQIRRRDHIAAFVFAGYDSRGAAVASASFFCG